MNNIIHLNDSAQQSDKGNQKREYHLVVIRFLGFVSKTRNEPPFHALEDDSSATRFIISTNNRQIRARRGIIQRAKTKHSNKKSQPL